VLTAHPDLAGKLAAAKHLTGKAPHEQSQSLAPRRGLTNAERTTFTDLNTQYVAQFGFLSYRGARPR